METQNVESKFGIHELEAELGFCPTQAAMFGAEEKWPQLENSSPQLYSCNFCLIRVIWIVLTLFSVYRVLPQLYSPGSYRTANRYLNDVFL